jgi:hypothetical protein
MAKRHAFLNWFYSITKQKILLETNKMASKLLFFIYGISFRIIELVAVWMQRFEICDFVCKKACIEWERASSGELRYMPRLVFYRKMRLLFQKTVF